jgi:hypothetical protein
MTMLQNFDGLIRPLFIETGTCEGNTLAHAAAVFPQCLSIEQNEVLYERSCERFKDTPNVRIFHGHSPRILKDILDPKVPTTFWLDAHYFSSANMLSSIGGECPLLEEVQVIAGVPWETAPIIIADDAFMFCDSVSPPGLKWPMSFWKSNECENITYHRKDWPRVEQLDEVLVGYARSMLKDEMAFRWDWKG